mmetsp:Transcript_1484/g.1788  ORF Transcript_1484/g.1788 Transcript_1484/m.1788 type:complete len:251 (+) Transcript_1484:197-949(+)
MEQGFAQRGLRDLAVLAQYLKGLLVAFIDVLGTFLLQNCVLFFEDFMELVRRHQLDLLSSLLGIFFDFLLGGTVPHAVQGLLRFLENSIELRHHLRKRFPQRDEVGEEDDAFIIGQGATVILVVILEALADHQGKFVLHPLLRLLHHFPEDGHGLSHELQSFLRPIHFWFTTSFTRFNLRLHVHAFLHELCPCGAGIDIVLLENLHGLQKVLFQMWRAAKPVHHLLVVDLAICIEVRLLQHLIQVGGLGR